MVRKYSKIIYLIIYKFLLEIIFVKDIAPFNWGYKGLEVNFNFENYCISWIAYFVFTSLYITDKGKWVNYNFRDFIYLFLWFIPLTSGIILYGLGTLDSLYFVYFCIFYLFLHFWKIFFEHIDLKLNININDTIKKYIVLLLILLLSIFVFYVFITCNIKFYFDDLENVYSQRSYFKKLNIPIIIKYILGSGLFINIFFIIYSFYMKKWYYLIFGLFVQYCLFSIAADKIVLFSVIIIFIFILISDKLEFYKFLKLALIGLLFITVYSSYMPYSVPVSYLRRILFIPNLLSYNYYDYFQNHIPIYLKINQDLYSNLPYLIAEIYHNKPSMAATNGLIGDAISNLGNLGIYIYPFILNLYFAIILMFSKNINSKFVVGIAFLVVLVLQDSFFTTSLLSHGLLFVIIMFFLFPDKF